MVEELIQIVDENDRPTTATTRVEAYSKGLIHRVTRVIVEDSDGNILLQRRTEARRTYPNCWDSSAAGHVDAGETYEQAATRELKEELGIDASKLVEVDYYRTHGSFASNKLNRFNKLYKMIVPRDVMIRLQAEEVAEVKWVTRAELLELVAHTDKVADGLMEIAERIEKL